jgi:hypothetical protein
LIFRELPQVFVNSFGLHKWFKDAELAWLSIRFFFSSEIAVAALFGSRRWHSHKAAIDIGWNYLSEELIELNLESSSLMVAIIARLIPAAISRYSMAAAPVSSAGNARTIFIMMKHYNTKALSAGELP